MKKQAFNPYLPLDTCIPDGEPHVFGDRLYLFGSHDKTGGEEFCLLPYEAWSAPKDDLSDWRCEGTIYRPWQDPDYGENLKWLFAPDVVQGPDGRYYLYYAMSGPGAFTGPIHVAVCDAPGGAYQYYGAVRTQDGEELRQYLTFDPGVMNDEGQIWLYYGWSLDYTPEEVAVIHERTGSGRPEHDEQVLEKMAAMFGKSRREILESPEPVMGANVVRLAPDMLTIMEDPKRIVPGPLDASGTSFERHAFFEASSMRKIGSRYYFIYSSQYQHELCYATGARPDGKFEYGGVILSNGDIGCHGRKPEERVCVTGNNHGSLVQADGQWYIFYHRQTHKTTFSRQGCAEPVRIEEDGSIRQVPMTSCGLNKGPLEADGTYPAAICCHLTDGAMPHQEREPVRRKMPHITSNNGEWCIAEILDGTRIGYKYFHLEKGTTLQLTCRGTACGKFRIFAEHMQATVGTVQETGSWNGVTSGGEKLQTEIPVGPSKEWTTFRGRIGAGGLCALYFEYAGEGELELLEFSFS